MKKINILSVIVLMSGLLFFTSCGDDDEKEDDEPDTGYTVPTTYEFKDADGNSTVSFSGQTERLNMLAAMTTLMKTGNTQGTEVSAADLKLMFANDDAYTWGDTDLDASTKDLKSKTIDAGDFEAWMDSLEVASKSTVAASSGVAGVVGGSYLVGSTGIEYTQLIEKGMMAKTFFNQQVNNYLTNTNNGIAADNSTIVDGKFYTEREHHFDEAFGYFGAPIDFPTTEGDFIAKYSGTVDDQLGTNKAIMDAFLKGRAAISNSDDTALDEAVEVLYEQLELVFAGAAIHYLNGTSENIADDAKRSHELSEAWAFMSGMAVSPSAKVSQTELQAMYDKIGTDFWNITGTSVIEVRNEIATKYGITDAQRDAL